MTDSDPTVGDAPILDPGPTVQVGDRTIQIRRLGIKDTFAVARIIAVGASASNRPLSNAEMTNPERMGELLLAGFVAAEKTAMDFLASLVGVTVKELQDPEQFPMGTELDIIMALVEHQDLKAFLSRAGVLMKKLPETRTRSQEQSA